MEPTTDHPKVLSAGSAQPLPDHIGRYRILERLGSGGMGTVYKAHDPELDRVVAVKLPRFDGPEQERAVRVQRFQREARAAAQVWHPQVCPIFDVGEHDGQPFVVMAYLEGQPLAQRLADERRYHDVNEAVILVRQILDALDAVHARGIIHRDMKPGNIVLDKTGRGILTDFGLARPEKDAEHLTSDGLVVGTPSYMAPEQAAGQSDQIGPWTDLYSLGVVFYQMLTGRLPFEGPALTVLAKILHEAPVPLCSHRPELGGGLDTIVQKALAKNIKERYQHAREFSSDLDRWYTRHSDTAPSLVLRSTLPASPLSAAELPHQGHRPGDPARGSDIAVIGESLYASLCSGLEDVGVGGLPMADQGLPSTATREIAVWHLPKGRRWLLGGALGVVLLLFLGSSLGWWPRILPGSVRETKSSGTTSRPASTGMKTMSTGKKDPREEGLAIRLEAALQITDPFDKDEALGKVTSDAAAAGFGDLVKKGVAAVGRLNVDDVAADCALKLADAGQKKAAFEVAQMLKSLLKRDEIMKKLATDSK
jgi:serine/threonine protein kinase